MNLRRRYANGGQTPSPEMMQQMMQQMQQRQQGPPQGQQAPQREAHIPVDGRVLSDEKGDYVMFTDLQGAEPFKVYSPDYGWNEVDGIARGEGGTSIPKADYPVVMDERSGEYVLDAAAYDSQMTSEQPQMAHGGKFKIMKKFENGGVNGDPKSDRKKGSIYYDEAEGKFFKVMSNGSLQHLSGRPGDQTTIIRHMKEIGGGDAMGLPMHNELAEKYPDLTQGLVNHTTPGGRQTLSGMKHYMKAAIQQALETGDPLLMSALINPYNDKTSTGAIGGIDAYGLDRIHSAEGPLDERGIQFRPWGVTDDGKAFSSGPSNLLTDVIKSDPEDALKSLEGLETIIDPKTGQSININPNSAETPGFGEGSPSTNPDVVRTLAEGAVPYQLALGGLMRRKGLSHLLRKRR